MYNAMKSDIIAAKKHRHWAKRQYLKYPSILSKHQSYKAKNSMVKTMQNSIYLKLTQRLQKRVCLPNA